MMKTRFCPSPTGYIHLGNARTALFSALLAKKLRGKFLIRVEDTDQERSQTQYSEQLFKDLHWLHLPWQEGPTVGGDAGPYYQSQRQTIYDQYYVELEKKDLVYPCFCSNTQLNVARKVQLSQGLPPKYSGTCRHLSKETIAAKLQEGLQPTLRFKVNVGETIAFEDLVKGPQQFSTDVIGDFIIRRADNTAPFLYCNAIDDALMKVTHVLRGDDHLTNTPRQILILKALGLEIPHYGHLSLILGSDGGPLSKRDGSRSIIEMQKAGFLPEGIQNYLARLGHYYAKTEFMDLDALAEHFETQHLGKSPARFDADQLLYWQHEAVLHANDVTIWKWFGQEVHELVPHDSQGLFIKTIKPNVNFPQDALQWAHIIFKNDFQIDATLTEALKNTHPLFFVTANEYLQQHGLNYSGLCDALKNKLNVKGKELFQPLRIALTGQLHGPEMAGLLQLIGLDNVITRFSKATLLFVSS